MRTRIIVSALIALGLAIGTPGQQPSQDKQKQPAVNAKEQQEKNPKKSDDVVRISVTLVQVDVAVTDKKGRPVSDLKPEDFEIYEDGRRQSITNFAYIASEAVAATAETKTSLPVPPPPSNIKPADIRRTVALVVDDLTLTLESTPYVKQALKKFVDEQMQPGDLVAIVRTGAGMGALQMFTADKRVLYAAIERVRWSPSSNTLYTFAPVQTNVVNPNQSIVVARQEKLSDYDAQIRLPIKPTDEMDKLRQEVFSIGTLGALQFVVKGLKDLPGRKSIVLFSEGLRIYNREQNVFRVREALRSLTDLANRSSAVIYTMDARGLQPLQMTAADDLSGDFATSMNDFRSGAGTPQGSWLAEPGAYSASRTNEFIESQDGLNYLAQQTGGFFIKNNNDLAGGIHRVMKDLESYYLIGFVPEESTFKSEKARGFHDLKVKVNRPDIRVRTRSGFYGISDEEDRTLQKTLGQTLLNALTSPFKSGDIALRLTSMFAVDPQKGPFVSSLMHIDSDGLTFAKEANGERKASFEIAAFTFGDNGKVVDQNIRAYTIRMTEHEYERTLKTGIFYRVNLTIKKPGAYQLRTAVRDTATLKVGSANQFIEVPDIKRGVLTMSGLVVRGRAVEGASKTSGQITSTAEGRVEEEDPQIGPGVRRFRRGMAVEYASIVYNARVDKATHRAQLETQLALYKDGKAIFVGKPKPFDPGQQSDLSRLVAGGSLLLGKELEPGDYALQLIIIDKSVKDDKRLTSQWIDFEVTK